MVSAQVHRDAKSAVLYFGVHLQAGEGERQVVPGVWFGRGAERLGLGPGSPVSQEAFARLCHHRHPFLDQPLTQRFRRNGRCYVNVCVSAPKSLSVLALVMNDPELLGAHSKAVQEVMLAMEAAASCRVRAEGQDRDHTTGNVVGARFDHLTSREGDCQVHSHLVLFNITYDQDTRKALQTGPLYEEMRFYTERYRNVLAHEIQKLGYDLVTTQHGFEIAGVPVSVLEKFSQRSAQIRAAEQAMEARLGHPISNNARAFLARLTRKPKEDDAGTLVARHLKRLSHEEKEGLERVVTQARRLRGRKMPRKPERVHEAIEFAQKHLFERASVVKAHELYTEALRFARGEVEFSDLERALPQNPALLKTGQDRDRTEQQRFTTHATLAAEREMLSLVRKSKERFSPIAKMAPRSEGLNSEQTQALVGILKSRDGVIRLAGAAGTGKTTLLQAIVRELDRNHQKVFACAPLSTAVEVLRETGFKEAATLQSLLMNSTLQQSVRGHLLFLDEASLASTVQIRDFLRLAQSLRCRVILSGDTLQHHAVEAGDGLRLAATKVDEVETVHLNQIQRQKNAAYKKAIESLAQGDPARGLAQLKTLGHVAELEEGRHTQAALAYVQALQARQSVLMVCPTWKEIDAVTPLVRSQLQEAGFLQKEEKVTTVHESLGWTLAQKQDWRNYEVNQVLTFHRRTGKFIPGQSATVTSVHEEGVSVRSQDGHRATIKTPMAKCYDVARERHIALAVGETLLIQSNSHVKEGRLLNGQLVTVKKLRRNGEIVLEDGRVIDRHFKRFTHGYALTSQAVQGKTADTVIAVIDAKASGKAVSFEQTYVSLSRGRHQALIFTDDFSTLEQKAQDTSARLGALESRRATPKLEIHLKKGHHASSHRQRPSQL